MEKPSVLTVIFTFCLVVFALFVDVASAQEVRVTAGATSAPLMGYISPAPIVSAQATWQNQHLLIRQELSLDAARKLETGHGWTVRERTSVALGGRSWSPIVSLGAHRLDAGLWTKATLWWTAGVMHRSLKDEVVLAYRGQVVSSAANHVKAVDLGLSHLAGRWVFSANLSVMHASNTPPPGGYFGYSLATQVGYQIRR